jgi:hypothetical protein
MDIQISRTIGPLLFWSMRRPALASIEIEEKRHELMKHTKFNMFSHQDEGSGSFAREFKRIQSRPQSSQPAILKQRFSCLQSLDPIITRQGTSNLAGQGRGYHPENC